MYLTKRLITSLLCALLCVSSALAQGGKAEPAQASQNIAQDVMIIIQRQQVRFTAQRAIEEMRLQIFDQSGEMIYDSGSIVGPEIDWSLQNANGETVKSGLYAYTLSIRETGTEKARERRGHFIVDRAQDRDGADKLWVTSQNDSGVGAELTVARAGNNSDSAEEIQPGMVVTIDPINPGKLRISRRAYDRRVAGVISGAGGVQPGMMMGQEGTLADGKHPVALGGRVYVWVDATRGSVKPGDLLTTSATPGYAMKAANTSKAQGAIIGKAMTGLKSGKGLALALITLR